MHPLRVHFVVGADEGIWTLSATAQPLINKGIALINAKTSPLFLALFYFIFNTIFMFFIIFYKKYIDKLKFLCYNKNTVKVKPSNG